MAHSNQSAGRAELLVAIGLRPIGSSGVGFYAAYVRCRTPVLDLLDFPLDGIPLLGSMAGGVCS